MEQSASMWSRTYGRLFRADTWNNTLYLLLTLFTGVLWFSVTLTLLVTGVSTLIIWIGIPILFFTFWVVRFGAQTERSLIKGLVGTDIPDPHRRIPDETSFWVKWKLRATDQATWRDLIYLWLLMPLGILWFSMVAVLWSVPLGLMSSPILLALGLEPAVVDNDRITWALDTPGEAWIAFGVGVLLLAVVPALIGLMARAQAGLARALLGPTRRSLERRVDDLVAIRETTLTAAEAERQRIERDLHDGAQVSLVALAMNLGRAKSKFESDPEAAQALVEESHLQAKQALVELRDLARGIHPTILIDRGLDAAISALAGRSPVPVQVAIEDVPCVTERIESVAYFVIAESLANVAKHAHATRASVTLAGSDGMVTVEISDDGDGGADASGPGLSGLANRVSTVGGRLTVSSPSGGPTRVRAEIPCE
jgi:signal transduction histidine kinase